MSPQSPDSSAAQPGPRSKPRGARESALARAVVELEEHVSGLGWDAPVGVFALVRTAAALETDPAIAEILDDEALAAARKDPESLTVIEQEDLPGAADLEDLLAQLAWPESVDGVALSVERVTLPAQAEAEAAAIEAPEERVAYLQSRADRDDVRIVVGVLRSGESWCAIRARSKDHERSVAQGDTLVPGLINALRATLL
ncbi:PPA1309 family protein [Actinomyces radicidentis]|uniref:PPA1309 family protein n=1 Tax=Actinomyces radicidentis TaxID=111015 RepID=UPI0026DFCF4F|nr:PPA1309 family protein [Actinomyces radicidentis]